MKRNAFRQLVCALSLLAAGGAKAQHLPLWELGAGASVLRLPAYRGAARDEWYGGVFPYFIYRGEKFRVDDEGVTGRIFNLNRVRLDISLGANVPVRREKNGLRAGMPGLDPVVELGPSLNVRLDDRSVSGRYWGIHFPFRPVLSTGADGMVPQIGYQGWLFAPHGEWLGYQRTNLGTWSARVTLGPLFGDADYHNYFYQVDAPYAAPDRPAYRARGGYSGTRFTSTVSIYPTSRTSLSLYMRYDNLVGAAFADSPLVADRHYLLVALTGIWVFWSSDRRVEHL